MIRFGILLFCIFISSCTELKKEKVSEVQQPTHETEKQKPIDDSEIKPKEESNEEPKEDIQEEYMPIGETNKNALDWQGKYSGVLPYSGCDGVKMNLQLFKDDTYELKEQYLGCDKGEYSSKGKISWDKREERITLFIMGKPAKEYQFFVGEGMLFKLDKNAKFFPGDLKDKYLLSRN